MKRTALISNHLQIWQLVRYILNRESIWIDSLLWVLPAPIDMFYRQTSRKASYNPQFLNLVIAKDVAFKGLQLEKDKSRDSVS